MKWNPIGKFIKRDQKNVLATPMNLTFWGGGYLRPRPFMLDNI